MGLGAFRKKRVSAFFDIVILSDLLRELKGSVQFSLYL